MGIGFVAWHTFDYRFRQRLKTTGDTELKRLFVLQNLFHDVENDLRDFERGEIRTGQVSYRKLTPSEWQKERQSIDTQINDLANYVALTNFDTNTHDLLDPREPSVEKQWVDELRDRLRAVTNAPAK